MGRIFNTYGPRMHPFDGRVVSNFIRQALAGEDITEFGAGSQTRSFCFVSDLVDAFLTHMESPDDCVGPIHMGNADEVTMLELAELVIELTGSNSKIVHRPLPQDDPKQRQPALSLARDALGWSPTVSLREGLAETVAYFRSVNLADFRAPTPNYCRVV